FEQIELPFSESPIVAQFHAATEGRAWAFTRSLPLPGAENGTIAGALGRCPGRASRSFRVGPRPARRSRGERRGTTATPRAAPGRPARARRDACPPAAARPRAARPRAPAW